MLVSPRPLLVLMLLTLSTSAPAAASQILFFAEQTPCSGVPLTCFPGGPGFPILHSGSMYVPIDLPANSLIREIDLWGGTAQPVGIWDSTTMVLPPPLHPLVIPHNELLGFGPGDLDASVSFFAVDGINGAPYDELDYQLTDPFLLAAGGRYFVGVNGAAMVGGSDGVFTAGAFTSPAGPLSEELFPGTAIRVVGQVVPEPSTLLLMLSGGALLWRRARVRSRAQSSF